MKRLCCLAPRPSAGFTLVELVMTILIIGALAAFAIPRMLDLTAWRLQAYAGELQAQAMAMQRLALVQRRPVVASFTSTGVTFAYVAGGTLVTHDCPSTASPCLVLSGSPTVTFNAGNSGSTSTSTGAAVPVSVSSGSTTMAYQLEAETGLFRALP